MSKTKQSITLIKKAVYMICPKMGGECPHKKDLKQEKDLVFVKV